MICFFLIYLLWLLYNIVTNYLFSNIFRKKRIFYWSRNILWILCHRERERERELYNRQAYGRPYLRVSRASLVRCHLKVPQAFSPATVRPLRFYVNILWEGNHYPTHSRSIHAEITWWDSVELLFRANPILWKFTLLTIFLFILLFSVHYTIINMPH